MIQWLCELIDWLSKGNNNDTDTCLTSDIDNNDNGTSLTDLPDDIVINILSRLPVRCILNLQTVCKKWLALTSSSHFAETHFKSGAKSQISKEGELDLYLYDAEAERYKLVKIMSNGFVKLVADVSPLLVGSCNGLLVFKMFLGPRYLAWDLVTRECAYIDAPTNVIPSPTPMLSDQLRLSAILSHSSIQGYKLLFSKKTSDSADQYEFFIYESRNKMWRKLSNSSAYPPLDLMLDAIFNPTIFKRYLLWMATGYVESSFDNPPPCRSSVVIFNMDVEEFRCMPHPGNECRELEVDFHMHMYIFEEKGQLYFVKNYFDKLELWTLESYDHWFWVKRYTIKLDYVIKKISPRFRSYPLNTATFIKIEGGALYFYCPYRGLFVYDWKKETVKKLDAFHGTTEHNFTYSDTSLSLESGFRCKTSRGLIHGAAAV